MNSSSEKKILVVDNEVSILEMLTEVFRSVGYMVRTAENAEEALNILKEEIIKVMFLDLDLPGTNGIDLCKTIRKSNQMSIIHAFTGSAAVYGLMECRAAGFDDFFVKPSGIKLLLKAAEDAFEKVKRWEFIGEERV
jgi:DNA-binding response OmpR family regulator